MTSESKSKKPALIAKYVEYVSDENDADRASSAAEAGSAELGAICFFLTRRVSKTYLGN